MIKLCLQCGSTIYGRIDKRFCDDICRSTWHNRKSKDHQNLIRNVNRTLQKNRRILMELNPNGKSKVRKEILIGKGFDFNYFTGNYINRKGSHYHFVYDQGYVLLENNNVALIVKHDYVDKQKVV